MTENNTESLLAIVNNEKTPPSVNISYVTITSGVLIDAVNKHIFMTQLLPSFIYVAIAMVIGIIGNGLVIFIYTYKKSKSTSRTFILAMAVLDFFNCSLSMTSELALLINFITFDQPFVCKASRYVTSFCTNATTVVLITIAADRYRKICKPLAVSLTNGTATRIVYFAVIFGILSSIPMVFIYGTTTLKIPKRNFLLVGKTCLIEDSLENTMYPTVWIALVFTSHILSDFVLITLYTCIGSAVCKQTVKRRSLRENGQMIKIPDKNTSTEELPDDNDFAKQDIGNQSAKKMQASHPKQPKDAKPDNRTTDMRTRYGNRLPHGKGSFDKGRKLSLLSFTASLRRRRSSGSSSGSSNRGHQLAGKTSFMLFLVTVVFILSFLPFCIIALLRALDRNFYFGLSITEKAFYQFFLRSYFLQSVFNPIVYCFVSRHFRMQVRSLWPKIQWNR